MPTGDPADPTVLALGAGVERLAPVLTPHGFRAERPRGGRGSGGSFATAAFARDERRLELAVRGPSLRATYRLGLHVLDHASYMRALLGAVGGNAFPAYAHDVAVAFEALRSDLALHATDFVAGDGDAFRRCCATAEAAGRRGGFGRLSDVAAELGGA